jgi:hypothetical protein
LSVTAQRRGDDLAHLQRGARGRIDLVAVVRLDDLDVVAGGQRLGGHLQQLERDVHAHAHVGRHHDGHVAGGLRRSGLLRFGEAGGADDGLYAQLAAHRQVGQRALGAGEVDQHLAALQAGGQVGRDGHAAVRPRKAWRPEPMLGLAGLVQRAGQHAVVRWPHRLDQHAAHAAGGPGHTDAK